MSADAWGLCPKCQERQVEERRRALAAADEAYGTLPSDEWMALNEAATKDADLEETLRQNYEQGIHEGEYFVAFGAACTECDFSFEFHHTQPFPPPGEIS